MDATEQKPSHTQKNKRNKRNKEQEAIISSVTHLEKNWIAKKKKKQPF